MDKRAVVMVDGSGVIRFWSGGAQAMFGHAADQAVGQTLDLIVPAQYRAAHWQGFRRALASGAAAAEGQIGPFPVLSADGVIKITPGRLTLLRQAAGETFGAMVIFG